MFAYLIKLRTLVGLIVLVYLQGCAVLDPYAKKEDVPTATDPVTTYPTQPEQPYTPPPYTDPVVVDTPTTTIPPAPTTPSNPSFDTTTYHYVQTGENLYRIGLAYGVTTEDLLRWNPNINPTDLRIGQRLAVSGAPASNTTAPPVVTYPVDTTPTTPSFGYDNPTPTTPVVTPPVSSTNFHIVQAGETLFRISKMYGVTVQQLQAWNNNISPSSLAVGQRLIVSTGGSASIAPIVTAPSTTSYHTVQRGDTLYNISRRYGMSVNQLASLNGLFPPYPALSIGQTLAISGSSTTTTTPPPATTTTQYHTVQAGETLFRISKMYGVTVQQLQAWNNNISPSSLAVGQRLAVSSPSGLASQSSYYNPNTYNSPTSTATPSSSYSLLSSSRVTTSSTPPLAVNSPSYHIVENNETLSSIAQKYDVTTHELAIWNGIGTPYTVFPGQKLLIP